MILEKVLVLLEGCDFTVVQHPPTRTSEESASARGEELKIGGKALVLKLNNEYGIFVLSADHTIDNKRLKEELGIKKIRFASVEELLQLTGLPPGAVPPFGRPIIDLNLYVDPSILENEFIAFNAGSLTTSIKLKVEDYLKRASPVKIFSYATKKI
jgi:prolyl-tRNA editing enzyme YbaK/EbsC (Cys-tRNA(Pro) deacylase)